MADQRVGRTPDSPVHDAEVLYRSVPAGRGLIVPLADGSGRPSSQAFADRGQETSVDRAALLEHDPERAKFRSTDGILWLIAAEARQIQVVKEVKEPGKPSVTTRLVADVVPDPQPHQEPPRPAHALIRLTPELGSRSNFAKLCERLARLTMTGRWAAEPAEWR